MLSIPQEIKDRMTKLQAEMECLKLNINTIVRLTEEVLSRSENILLGPEIVLVRTEKVL